MELFEIDAQVLDRLVGQRDDPGLVTLPGERDVAWFGQRHIGQAQAGDLKGREAGAIDGTGPASAGARVALAEARRGQAEALFDAARAALAKDVPRGQRLLNEYLAHPDAVGAAEARALQADLRVALSDREALRHLGTLSDEALARFERISRTARLKAACLAPTAGEG